MGDGHEAQLARELERQNNKLAIIESRLMLSTGIEGWDEALWFVLTELDRLRTENLALRQALAEKGRRE